MFIGDETLKDLAVWLLNDEYLCGLSTSTNESKRKTMQIGGNSTDYYSIYNRNTSTDIAPYLAQM